ncbi:hypothetical protein AZ78_0871 [Lysobacter capsici AZ78]|uniref:Uncharacterized protein n=1 Tax=Lysobacter capsici AZ78 TaxID=1444315 RepID=A0A108U697_9GAMM|nr:hypothetical protein AZ78_0871 [Lysobacter capsici AZ78]
MAQRHGTAPGRGTSGICGRTSRTGRGLSDTRPHTHIEAAAGVKVARVTTGTHGVALRHTWGPPHTPEPPDVPRLQL